MKKLITIASITLVLFAGKVSAKTVVSAGGKTVTLSAAQINYLHGYNNPYINNALLTMPVIKYNSTADIIINLLSKKDAPKTTHLLIAKR